MKKSEETPVKLSKTLELVENLKKRIRETVKPAGDDPNFGHVSDMVDRFPMLHAVMHAHLERGGPDRGGTITIWGSEEGIGGVFGFEHLGIKMFFASGSLYDALQCVEDALADPDHKWKKERPKDRKRKGYGSHK